MDTEVPDRYRQLDALACPAVYVDRDGAILAGNEAFHELWRRCGTSSGVMDGCPLLDVFAPDEHQAIRRTLGAPDVSVRPLTRTARLAASLAPAMTEFVPIRRKSHAGLLWLVTLRSDQRSSDLSDNEASRAALTAGVVHDLRTPLQSVLGWASLLRRTREPERIEYALTVIERNATVQMQLLEDLLELLRPAASRLQLRRQRVDLARLVKAELRAVEPLAEECQVRVSLTVDSPAADVEGYETHLRRVVANLVANALKFTPRGGSIDCRVWRSSAWAGIVVRDNGRGIDPAFVPRVFDAFSQEPAGIGWGLGLNVVRHLVKLHGGTVTAASAGHGYGATFSVVLPATPQLVAAGEMPVACPAV